MESIENLFNNYNKDYFNDELNEIKSYLNLTFKWLPLTIKSTGRFIVDGNTATIAVSERCKGSETLLRNTVVHEMIHLKQRLYSLREGRMKYLDQQRLAGSKLWQNKGHGHYFLTWANELNKAHPELNITVKDSSTTDMDYELPETLYVVVVTLHEERSRMFSSPTRHIDLQNIVLDGNRLFGEQSVKSVKLYSTKVNSAATQTKLTASNAIPVRCSSKLNFDEDVEKVITHQSSTLLDSYLVTREYDSGLSTHFEDAVKNPRLTYVRYGSFTNFLYYICEGNKEWEETFDNGIDIFLGKHPCVTKAHVDYAYQYWKRADVNSMLEHIAKQVKSEIKKCINCQDINGLKHYIKVVTFQVGSSRSRIGNTCAYLKEAHTKSMKGRTKSFTQNMFDDALSQLKQENRTFIEYVAINPNWLYLDKQGVQDFLYEHAINCGFATNGNEVRAALAAWESPTMDMLMHSNKTRQITNQIIKDIDGFFSARTQASKDQIRKTINKRLSDTGELLKNKADKDEVIDAIWREAKNQILIQTPEQYKSEVSRKIDSVRFA